MGTSIRTAGAKPTAAQGKPPDHVPANVEILAAPDLWLQENYFLHSIPRIMRKLGWTQGAIFQEKWLTAPGQRKTRRNERGLPIDDTTIKMDWVIGGGQQKGFGRARQVYIDLASQVRKGSFWQEAERFLALRNLILQAAKQGGLRPGGINFPPAPSPLLTLKNWALHDWSVAQFPVGTTEGSHTIPVLDGLTAALGRFSFYVVPVGAASRLSGGKYDVRLDEIGVYILDSFDFNDNHEAATDADDTTICNVKGKALGGHVNIIECSQVLGVWRLSGERLHDPHTKTGYVRIGLKMGCKPDLPGHCKGVKKEQVWDLYADPRSQPMHDIYIGNATYRNYRQQTKHGGDFMIFSDVKVIPLQMTLAQPIQLEIPIGIYAAPK